MRTLRILVQLACAALVVWDVGMYAGGSGSSTQGTAVTATAYDDYLNVAQRLRSDDYNGSGYAQYFNGLDGVQAILVRSGNFVMDTNTTSGPAIRKLTLDFTLPADNSGCKPPFQTEAVDSALDTTLRNAADTGFLSGGFPAMSVGQSLPSSLGISFADPVNSKLQWNVLLGKYQYPSTSNVEVTRTDNTTWEIHAPGIHGASGTSAAVALLESVSTSGKNVRTPCGYFNMPLNISVATQ